MNQKIKIYSNGISLFSFTQMEEINHPKISPHSEVSKRQFAHLQSNKVCCKVIGIDDLDLLVGKIVKANRKYGKFRAF